MMGGQNVLVVAKKIFMNLETFFVLTLYFFGVQTIFVRQPNEQVQNTPHAKKTRQRQQTFFSLSLCPFDKPPSYISMSTSLADPISQPQPTTDPSSVNNQQSVVEQKPLSSPSSTAPQ
jgi:hypothetical protein